MDLPLVEDDLTEPGMLAPGAMRTEGSICPDVLLCFFSEVVDALGRRPDARQAATLRSELGRSPVWVLGADGPSPVAVAHPGIGGPFVAAALEELIVMGGRRFVACGAAGVLVPELVLGHAVVVDSAVRDEGTSFHYLPPSRTIETDPRAVAALAAALHRAGIAHTVGRTWTTDAVYRETPSRIRRRRAEGCLTVEMEAAALLAVSRFRSVTLAQVLFAGDSLAGEEWDDRGWTTAHDARAALAQAALDACRQPRTT